MDLMLYDQYKDAEATWVQTWDTASTTISMVFEIQKVGARILDMKTMTYTHNKSWWTALNFNRAWPVWPNK